MRIASQIRLGQRKPWLHGWKAAAVSIYVQILIGLAAVIAVVLASSAAAQADPVRQMIVVSAPSAKSTTASLTAYERTGEGWQVVLGPTPAQLGELGIGTPQDDVFRTPTGTFPLGQAFGREPNPGTRMPYFQTTEEDWWDEDVDSSAYNTHVRTANINSDDAENLYTSGVIYDYAVLIDHNPRRIPGRSAGIFLHVTDGDPTWGCVAIERDQMRSVLRWLDPSAHPQIVIGVDLGGPPASPEHG
ncbi:L,D-transpeptidase family protein [Mycolicibacterium nivoides]|uniref:L,D-transpeptidase n=1 Tax=Mycolicibacterium nivoides TaxID=2487344 RepID=A0ABW9LGV3_9MYCO